MLSEIEAARGDLLLARIIDFARFLWELGLDIGPGAWSSWSRACR